MALQPRTGQCPVGLGAGMGNYIPADQSAWKFGNPHTPTLSCPCDRFVMFTTKTKPFTPAFRRNLPPFPKTMKLVLVVLNPNKCHILTRTFPEQFLIFQKECFSIFVPQRGRFSTRHEQARIPQHDPPGPLKAGGGLPNIKGQGKRSSPPHPNTELPAIRCATQTKQGNNISCNNKTKLPTSPRVKKAAFPFHFR